MSEKQDDKQNRAEKYSESSALRAARRPRKRRGRTVALAIMLSTCVPLFSFLCAIVIGDFLPSANGNTNATLIEARIRAELEEEYKSENGPVALGMPPTSAVRTRADTLMDANGRISLSDYLALAVERGLDLNMLFDLQTGPIAIDPGRGGRDEGVIYAGLMEKDIMLDLGQRLQTILVNKYGLKAVMTRTQDQTLSQGERLEIARASEAGAMVSLHLGRAQQGGRSALRSYYFGFTSDPQLLDSAIQRNQGNGMTVADFRRSMRVFEDSLMAAESRRLAASVQSQLSETVTDIGGLTLMDGGTGPAPFSMLLSNQIPSTIVEVGTLLNDIDANRWLDPRFRDQLAESLADGIAYYMADQSLRIN